MERKLDRNRRLADYIYNDLNSEEVVELEKEISQDPLLSESYQLNMQVKDYLQSKIKLEEMRSDPQLEDAEKLADMAFGIESHDEAASDPIPESPKRNRVRYLSLVAAVAASVTILIAVGIIPSSMDQDRLFDRYYEPVAASDNSQRGANELRGNVAAGINSYVEGNYSQSIAQFSALASDQSIQSEVQYFTALSYLGLGQFESSQTYFEVLLDGDHRYQLEALWYLSLCCLKTGEFDKAQAFLAQLENYEGRYKKDAQALGNKLRRLK
jgi:hypothetical protein